MKRPHTCGAQEAGLARTPALTYFDLLAGHSFARRVHAHCQIASVFARAARPARVAVAGRVAIDSSAARTKRAPVHATPLDVLPPRARLLEPAQGGSNQTVLPARHGSPPPRRTEHLFRQPRATIPRSRCPSPSHSTSPSKPAERQSIGDPLSHLAEGATWRNHGAQRHRRTMDAARESANRNREPPGLISVHREAAA